MPAVTPAKAQNLGTASGNGSTVVLTLSGINPTVVGNVAKVYVRTGGGAHLSTVADSKGNTWTVNAKGTSANVNSAVATTVMTTSLVNGDTITVTPNSTQPNTIFGAAEFTGVAQSAASVAAVDQAVNAHGTSSPISVATSSTTGLLDLVLSAVADSIVTGVTTVSSADPDSSGTWAQLGSVNNGVGGAYEIAPNAASNFSVGWTAGGAPTNVDACIVALIAGLGITTAATNIPNGTVGTAYSKNLSAQGGSGTRTWSISSGSLPTGLSISGSTISGTPSGSPGTASFTIQVADTGGNIATLAASITIGSSFSISTSSPLTSGSIGTSYSDTLGASGGTGTITWSVESGALPPGLALTGSSSTTSLVGATFAASNTLNSNYTFWKDNIYTDQFCKCYYTFDNGIVTPASLADASPQLRWAVANNIGVYLCYHTTAWGTSTDTNWPGTGNKPTKTIMDSEQAALLTSIAAHISIGVNLKGVVLNQELDGSKPYIAGQPQFTLTGDQATYQYYYHYKAIKTAHPTLDVCICYVDAASSATPSVRAGYFPGPSQLQPTGWGPKQTNGIGKCYVDGILVDAYCDTYINVAAHHAYSTTPLTAPGFADIADYNGIKFGWGEAGNSATGGLGGSTATIAVENMTKYLSTTTVNGNPGDATNSIPGVMGYRLSNNFPCLPVMWYENGGAGNTGSNNITDPGDYRVSMLSTIAALLGSSIGGQITGTPTDASGSPYSFTVKATDSTGATATKAFTLSVSGSAPTLTWVTTSPLPSMTEGVENSFQFSNDGGTQPYTYSITGGTLPPGITLTDAVNGVLSGTPTASGTYTFTVHVVDSATPTPQTLSQSFSMTINPLTVTGTPYLAGSASAPAGSALTLDIPIITEVQAGDFLQVGVLATAAQTITVADTAGNTYSLNTPGTGSNPDTTETGARLYVFEVDGSLALSPVPADPSDPTSQPDSIQVTYSTTASAQAAIAVGDNGPSSADKMRIAHGSGTAVSTGSTGTLSQVEEHAIAFIADTSTGTAPTWSSPFSSNVLDTENGAATAFLSAAYTTVTSTSALTAAATITSAPWAAAITTFGVALPSLTTTLASGVEGDPYSQTFVPAGGIGPFTYSITVGAPPSGLTLSSGVISGTPTTSGTFDFTVQVTDTNSVSATSAQSITILPNTLTRASSLTFPGDLLDAADSDFESGVGSWVNDANASSLTTSSNASVTGDNSLMWSATAAGATSVHSGPFPVNANDPYIVSGYIMPAGMRDTYIGINWYSDSAGTTLISQSLGPDNASDAISWQPVQAALTAPTGAVSGRVVALVQEANLDDVEHLDSVFIAQSGVQILIDWTNAPFVTDGDGDAGDDFMDVSPWVRLDQNITLSRGRQDMISEIQAGSASFYLQNDSGAFTRFKSSSLPEVIGGQVGLQKRTQINLTDDDGNWWTRFDGNISEIDYTFDTTGNTSLAQVSVTDILSYLGRVDEFNCWTKEQILADNPQWHWTLDDAGTQGASGVFSESSGNNGPALRLMSSDNSKTAIIAFQNTTGGVETLADAVLPANADGSEYWSAGNVQPSSAIRGLDSGGVGPYTTPLQNVYLTPKLTAQASQNQFIGNRGFQLQAELPTPMTPNAVGNDYAAECWFTMDPAIATGVLSNFGPYTVMSLGTSREGNCIIAAIYPTGVSTLVFHVQLFSQPPGFLGKNWPSASAPSAVADINVALNTGAGTNGMDNIQIPHHLVINIQGDPAAPVVTFALDGVLQSGSFTLNEQQYFDTVCLGGAFGGTGCHFGGLSLASIYNSQLSQDQIVTHCSLGQYGMWESTTDDCIASLSNFSNVPGYWDNTQAAHNGLSLTDYQDITGLDPLTAMETFEDAEQGLLFVSANGSLNFHTRDWRMGYGAPDLLLPPDSYTADLGYQIVDQFMQNESAIGSLIYTAGASYINQPSVDSYGPYSVNSPQAPAQLPLITFSRAEGQLGLPSFGLEADPNLSDAAQWAANAFGDPYLLPTSVTVDLLTLDPLSGLTIADLYALEIDNLIAPSGTLPASFPDENLSTEWFIEGVTETIGVTVRTIQFYCSPAEAQRAWIPGDPTYGVLGSTSRVGVSSVDLNPVQADGKDVSHDGGEPFWPPTFTSDMNNPAANGHSFVGALDMRGLVTPVSRILNPPMCIVSTISQIQTIGAASNAQPQIFWDTVHVDTEGGMGLVPGWSNWYVCTVPGFYDIDASLVWSQSGSGSNSGYMGQAWIVVAQKAAQAVAAGTGNPQTAPQYVCPVGESPRWNNVSMNAVDNPTTRVYLGIGDMVTLAAEQNTSGSIDTGTNLNGSHMSILFRGYGTDDDGCQYNSTINGGTVKDKPTVTSFTKTYSNKHTYVYWGGGANNGLRSQDGTANQGSEPGSGNGSQATQITFPYSTINSDLNPGSGTAAIQSCLLTATNITAGRPSGAYAMLGWWNGQAGESHFNAHGIAHNNVFNEFFATGFTKTFALPASFASAFQSGNATMLILGNGSSTRNNDFGHWDGGAGSWLLTIEYTVTT